MKKCPDCGASLASTGSGPGWMNEEQWDSVKAGDYYCTGSCQDPNKPSGLRYFRERDLTITEPHHNFD